jgi:hypothetical protein
MTPEMDERLRAKVAGWWDVDMASLTGVPIAWLLSITFGLSSLYTAPDGSNKDAAEAAERAWMRRPLRDSDGMSAWPAAPFEGATPLQAIAAGRVVDVAMRVREMRGV